MLTVRSPQETRDNLQLINREVTPNFEIGYVNINDVRIIESYSVTLDRNRLYTYNFLDPNGVTGGLAVGGIGIQVNVPTQYEVNLEQKEVTISSNGTTLIVPSSSYDGLEQVEVITNVQPSLEARTRTITENGDYTFLPNTGYDGISSVSLTVDVPTTPTDIELYVYQTINENGLYNFTPSTGFNAIGQVSVNVNVPQPVIESNRTWEVTSNGNFTIVPNIGRAGMSSVDLTVNVPTTANLQSVIANVNGNGTQVITPSSGYDGLSQVTINTNVEKRVPVYYISLTFDKAQGSFINLVSDTFTKNNTGSNLSISIPPGYTLINVVEYTISYSIKVFYNSLPMESVTRNVMDNSYYIILNFGNNYLYLLNNGEYNPENQYGLVINQVNLISVNNLRQCDTTIFKSSYVLPNIRYSNYQ